LTLKRKFANNCTNSKEKIFSTTTGDKFDREILFALSTDFGYVSMYLECVDGFP